MAQSILQHRQPRASTLFLPKQLPSSWVCSHASQYNQPWISLDVPGLLAHPPSGRDTVPSFKSCSCEDIGAATCACLSAAVLALATPRALLSFQSSAGRTHTVAQVKCKDTASGGPGSVTVGKIPLEEMTATPRVTA